MDNFAMVKDALSMSALAGHYSAVFAKGLMNPSPCCSHNDCCSVNEGEKVFKCFSCGAAGSAIDLIMAADSCDEHEALRKAAEIAGVTLMKYSDEGIERKKKETTRERILRLSVDYYHKAMLASDEGRAWFLTKRGHKEETMKKMLVGWSTGGLKDHLLGLGLAVEDCVKAGVVKDANKEGDPIPPEDYYYRAGFAIFPVVDHAGKIVTLTSKNSNKHKDGFDGFPLTGPKKWLLNYHALGKYTETFIVEGQNDIASFYDSGMENVVGTAGHPGPEQVKLIANFCSGKTVYLWFDRDEGGQKNTRYIYENLKGSNVEVKVVVHPGAVKDPDDYIRKGYAA